MAEAGADKGDETKRATGHTPPAPPSARRRRPPRLTGMSFLPLLAIAAGAWLLWQLSGIVLLVFAAIIVGVIMWSISEPLVKLTHLPRAPVLVAVILLLVAGTGALLFFFGYYLSTEFFGLLATLPDMVSQLGDRFGIANAGDTFGIWAEQYIDGGLFSDVAGYTMNLFSIGAAVLLVFFGGAFLAFGVNSYERGTLLLVPSQQRVSVRQFLHKSGRALRLWLLGQLIAMLVVGVATTIGLYLLGVPSALALGVLAGLLEFVPFVGSLVAFAAAFLVALGEDPWLALWVTLLMIGIQQVESNLLVPLVQKQTVSLPPALGLFAILAVGTLFGPMGVLLATPLTIIIIVAVKHFYVEGVLGEQLEEE